MLLNLTLEIAMNIAFAFAHYCTEDLLAQLGGGTLTIYSVARPINADLPVDRSVALATFTFASPAFAPTNGGQHTPLFTASPVATVSGTPGFARARTADGTVVADFSAGPGNREIKFSEVSFSQGVPVTITTFESKNEDSWPERRDYYETKPRVGYKMPPTL